MLSSLSQIWASLIGLLGPIGAGIAFIYSTVSLPNYQDPDSPILDGSPLTDDQASWFGKNEAGTESTPLPLSHPGLLVLPAADLSLRALRREMRKKGKEKKARFRE